MNQILLVDDHKAFGEGTKALIEREGDMKVTIVSNGIEALDLLEKETFDLLLYDLNMPAISGLELTRRTIVMNIETPIFIYTAHDIISHFNMLIKAGASGFISKTDSGKQLVQAIRGALIGQVTLPISLLKQLRRSDAIVSTPFGKTSIEDVSVTEKEQELLHHLAQGRSNIELTDILNVGQRRVEQLLTLVYGKLNVNTRLEAVIAARRLNLIPDEDIVGRDMG